MAADDGRRDERRDVRRNASGDEGVEILADRRPGDGVLEVALAPEALRAEPLVQRGLDVLAEDLQGHALADVALRAAVLDERRPRVAEHIDEAGGDREASRVDLARRPLAHLTDCDDPGGRDRDVALPRCATPTVIQRAATNDDLR